jgi:hypothetical protein
LGYCFFLFIQLSSGDAPGRDVAALHEQVRLHENGYIFQL